MKECHNNLELGVVFDPLECTTANSRAKTIFEAQICKKLNFRLFYQPKLWNSVCQVLVTFVPSFSDLFVKPVGVKFRRNEGGKVIWRTEGRQTPPGLKIGLNPVHR
jgi:hypothetical protein